MASAGDALRDAVRGVKFSALQIQQEPEADALREGVREGIAVPQEDAVSPADSIRDAGLEGEEARPQVYAHGPHAG